MDVKLYIEACKNEDANGTGLPVDIREVDPHKHKGLLQFTYISTSFVAIRKQVLTTLTEHNYKLKQILFKLNRVTIDNNPATKTTIIAVPAVGCMIGRHEITHHDVAVNATLVDSMYNDAHGFNAINIS